MKDDPGQNYWIPKEILRINYIPNYEDNILHIANFFLKVADWANRMGTEQSKRVSYFQFQPAKPHDPISRPDGRIVCMIKVSQEEYEKWESDRDHFYENI